MNIAQHHGKPRKARFSPAGNDIAEGSGSGDRKAQSGRGSYGVMHFDIAPHHERNGNEAAPPAPTNAETTPMLVPAPNIPGIPGRVLLGSGLELMNILTAEKPTKQTKTREIQKVGRRLEILAPRRAPTKIPGATAATTFQSTAPRL